MSDPASPIGSGLESRGGARTGRGSGPVRELYLLRHGETAGESSIRYHGANDVPLSDHGREQMRAARAVFPPDGFDAVVASPLSRALEGARIAVPDARVRVEEAFREVDFGRWEGLTREEIRARDPELYETWQLVGPRFDYPDGERRADFDARVAEGLDRLLALPAHRVLVVVHKGVIRSIAWRLRGLPLEAGVPDLGEVVRLLRADDGADRWQLAPPHANGIEGV